MKTRLKVEIAFVVVIVSALIATWAWSPGDHPGSLERAVALAKAEGGASVRIDPDADSGATLHYHGKVMSVDLAKAIVNANKIRYVYLNCTFANDATVAFRKGFDRTLTSPNGEQMWTRRW